MGRFSPGMLTTFALAAALLNYLVSRFLTPLLPQQALEKFPGDSGVPL